MTLPEFSTSNHTEHAALARCVLGVMSRDAGFDFQSNIDGCGGNMWIWHVKGNRSDQSLALVKPAETVFTTSQLPNNWRDHLEVVARRRARVRLGGIDDKVEDSFDSLASAHRRVELDTKHREVIDEIARLGYSCNWIQDHHLLQTHTMGFAEIIERREEFGIEGVYQTNSKGSDKATPNCFAFLLDHGGWKIFRFSPGCQEAPTWEQDGQGWTTCVFNVKANLASAARSLGAKPLKRGGYEFATLEEAVQVAKILAPEIELDVEDFLKGRKAVVSTSKDGKLAIEVKKEGTDGDKQLGGWNESDKKGALTQVFDINTSPVTYDSADYDNIIRCVETSNGHMAGWMIQKENGEWTRKNASSVKTILQEKGHPKPEAEMLMGRAERRPWKLVTLPFKPDILLQHVR